jgi:hypothetical protein
LDNILLAQKNLEIVLKNPCITFLPITIYKAQKEIINDLQRIQKKYLNCDMTNSQRNYLNKLRVDARKPVINPVHNEELTVCKDYEEAYEFYHDLYLESLYGV